jgi:hypothetical protein
MTEEEKPRSKKLTTEEATREVYRLFCRGMTRGLIFEYAKEQKWGLSERIITDVIERATERLIETAAVLNLDTEVGKALERLEALYQEAVTAKDTKTALAVQKEINSLLRLGERAARSGGAARNSTTPKTTARPRFTIAK